MKQTQIININQWNLTKLIKRKVQDDGKQRNWKRFIGKCIIIWAAIPGTLSLWMLPVGVCMSLGISPSLLLKKKIIDFNQWKRCWRL